MQNPDTHASALRTYIVIIALAALILFKGALALLMIGDMGQPTGTIGRYWAFRRNRPMRFTSPCPIHSMSGAPRGNR